MGKRLPYTPSSQIRSAFRRLWLRSRERGKALRDHKNCCARCGRKASKAKHRECTLDVHHLDAIDWEKLFEVIRAELLVSPDRLIPLCGDCHAKEHNGGENVSETLN